jgi:hypothetical protein
MSAQAAPGTRSTVADHRPPAAQAWQLHGTQWCLREAQRIGPSCYALVHALFGDQALIKLRAVQGVLRFAQQFGSSRLEAACRRASHFGTPSYKVGPEQFASRCVGVTPSRRRQCSD